MRFLPLLTIVLLIVAACSPSPAPPAPTSVALPTANGPATETAIAARIYANLTAAAPPGTPAVATEPPATVTPPPAPVQETTGPTSASATTAPVGPSPTGAIALSPSVTPIPFLPTTPPTRGPTVAPTNAPLAVTREGLLGKILFKSTRAGGAYPSNYQYYVMNADGSGAQPVPSDPASALANELLPLEGYSPDRQTVVIGEARCEGNAHCDLYIGAPAVVADRSQGQWTSGPAYSRADSPVWSPDGNWVAFTWNLDNDRTKNIYKGHPFGKPEFVRMTDFGGKRDTKTPTYSPDGQLLAFATQDGPRWQIWVLDANADNFKSGNPRNLGNSEFDDWDPLWIK